MAQYTTQEMINVVLCFGEARQNYHATGRLYHERYPDQRQPSRQTIRQIVQRFLNTGTVQQHQRQGRPRTHTTEETTVAVLASVAANPHISSRAIATLAGCSQRTVIRILRTNHFHPYHVHCHQELLAPDYISRTTFCNWFLCRLDDDPNFADEVLWSDEAQFSRDGVVNRHNLHYWAQENPRWLREATHQVNWRINVWCGMYNGSIVGPYFYEGTLTAERYRDEILNGMVADFVDNLPLTSYQHMWYQHDGAPPHFGLVARERLTEMFGDCWIGRGGPVRWPPRSPDLTPLDFFLWGYVKDKVYATQPTSQEDLQQRIQEACRTITPAMFVEVIASLKSRAQLCYAADGHHIEHLLD